MTCINSESPLAIYNMTGEAAIPQGADWSVPIRYLENDIPVDFSGFSGVLQVRRDYDAQIIIELSTDAGTILVGDGAANTPNVVLVFGSAATAALTEYSGIYDLELTSPSTGIVYKFIKGNWALDREVTK